MIEGNRRVDELIEWEKLHPGVMPPLTEEEKYRYFVKEGLPLPGTGAEVRPLNTLKISDEQGATIKKYNDTQNKKGYLDHFSKDAKFLSMVPQDAEKDFEEHKSIVLNPQDTHMRANLYDLKMNYTYRGVSPSLIHKVIGYSPEHTYVENGWNGAAEFFIPKFQDSVCVYHEVNIKLTGSSSIIPKEVVTYKINKKVTTITAEGNKDLGFIYQVEWWDKEFKRNLDCVSKEYSSETKDKIIDLARLIDTNQ